MGCLETLLIFQIISFTAIATGQKACSVGASFERDVNLRVRCGIFQTVALNHFGCQRKCVASLQCFSTNTYKDDSGSEVCELINGTKTSFDNSYCLEKRDGAIHSELTLVKSKTRKALRHGWYQLGSSQFKNLLNKTLNEAKVACYVNQGCLAHFENDMEKEFVGGLFKDALTAENAQNELKPGIHWRLDGSDKDVVLYGNASFKQDNDINTAVLDLPGTTGSYATTPAFPISKISFTISMWIKAPNLLSPGLAYSSWGNPHVFALKASWFSARRLHNPKAVHFSIINNNNLPKNQWINVVAVWDRGQRKAFLYRDGTQVASGISPEIHSQYLNFPNPNVNVFDIGYQRDAPSNAMTARIKDIVIFNQPLNADQVKLLKDLNSDCLSVTTGAVAWQIACCGERKDFVCRRKL